MVALPELGGLLQDPSYALPEILVGVVVKKVEVTSLSEKRGKIQLCSTATHLATLGAC